MASPGAATFLTALPGSWGKFGTGEDFDSAGPATLIFSVAKPGTEFFDPFDLATGGTGAGTSASHPDLLKDGRPSKSFFERIEASGSFAKLEN